MIARTLCGVAVLALSAAALADDALPPPLAEALRRSGLPPQSVAIVVQEAGAPRPRLSFNADRAMNPASAMKLVTTYAALELLGPAFTWKTTVHALGEPSSGVLDGDLYVKGGGDPKFTIEKLWSLIRTLRARGIRDIRGDLVVDRSYLDSSEFDPGKFDGEPLRPYNVNPDALLINYKATRLMLFADPVGKRWTVEIDPRINDLRLPTGSANSIRRVAL